MIEQPGTSISSQETARRKRAVQILQNRTMEAGDASMIREKIAVTPEYVEFTAKMLERMDHPGFWERFSRFVAGLWGRYVAWKMLQDAQALYRITGTKHLVPNSITTESMDEVATRLLKSLDNRIPF